MSERMQQLIADARERISSIRGDWTDPRTDCAALRVLLDQIQSEHRAALEAMVPVVWDMMRNLHGATVPAWSVIIQRGLAESIMSDAMSEFYSRQKEER